MTRLAKFADESLLCHTEHLGSLPRWFTAGRRNYSVGGITAFDVTDDASALDEIRHVSADSLPRILDHFYLWTPQHVPEGRQLLIDALFTVTAVDFTDLVHA